MYVVSFVPVKESPFFKTWSSFWTFFGKTQKKFIIEFLQSISVLVSADSDAVKYTGAESQQFLVSRSFLIESTDEIRRRFLPSPDFTPPQISPRVRFHPAIVSMDIQVPHLARLEVLPDQYLVQIQSLTRAAARPDPILPQKHPAAESVYCVFSAEGVNLGRGWIWEKGESGLGALDFELHSKLSANTKKGLRAHVKNSLTVQVRKRGGRGALVAKVRWRNVYYRGGGYIQIEFELRFGLQEERASENSR